MEIPLIIPVWGFSMSTPVSLEVTVSPSTTPSISSLGFVNSTVASLFTFPVSSTSGVVSLLSTLV